jgi:hypothetical protein
MLIVTMASDCYRADNLVQLFLHFRRDFDQIARGRAQRIARAPCGESHLRRAYAA